MAVAGDVTSFVGVQIDIAGNALPRAIEITVEIVLGPDDDVGAIWKGFTAVGTAGVRPYI